MQTKQFESPSFLPNLDALDAEFESKDEQYPAGRRRQGSASMDPTFRPTQSEFSPHVRAARPTVDATKRSSLDPITKRPSLVRRARNGSARFFIIFGLGVGTTLAWQSHGDAALGMIAKSSPQLAWLAPKTVPVMPTAPTAVTAAVPLPDLQQLALGLAAVRQSVDLLSGQVTAGQQQTGSDIAKLQADGQDILHKLAAAPPRPTAAPTHKPAAVPPPPSPSPQARN